MTKRILVVEDQEDNRQILRDLLSSAEYEMVEAENGEEALDAVAKQKPDLILMDIQLPIMDGYEATRRIKTQWPTVLIVGLSFSNPNQVEPLLLQAGASCYVSKDSAGDRLYEAIIATVKRDGEKQADKTATAAPFRDQS